MRYYKIQKHDGLWDLHISYGVKNAMFSTTEHYADWENALNRALDLCYNDLHEKLNRDFMERLKNQRVF